MGGRTIKANRVRWFKSIGLSFCMRRNVGRFAHAAGILAPAADAARQDLRDGVQSPGRGEQVGVREVIALGPLIGVDGHACVRARARWSPRWSVVPANYWRAVHHHLRKWSGMWRKGVIGTARDISHVLQSADPVPTKRQSAEEISPGRFAMTIRRIYLIAATALVAATWSVRTEAQSPLLDRILTERREQPVRFEVVHESTEGCPVSSGLLGRILPPHSLQSNPGLVQFARSRTNSALLVIARPVPIRILRDGAEPRIVEGGLFGWVYRSGSRNPLPSGFGFIDHVSGLGLRGSNAVLFPGNPELPLVLPEEVFVVGEVADATRLMAALPGRSVFRVSASSDLSRAMVNAQRIESAAERLCRRNAALVYLLPRNAEEAVSLGMPANYRWSEQYERVKSLGYRMFDSGSGGTVTAFVEAAAKRGDNLLVWAHSEDGHQLMVPAAGKSAERLCGCQLTRLIKANLGPGSDPLILINNCRATDGNGLAWTLVGDDFSVVAPKEQFVRSNIELLEAIPESPSIRSMLPDGLLRDAQRAGRRGGGNGGGGSGGGGGGGGGGIGREEPDELTETMLARLLKHASGVVSIGLAVGSAMDDDEKKRGD